MTKRDIPTGKMIFKVLVVGHDLPLQTGFLNRTSGDCISYQLYNTLGVSLGVSRFDYPENLEVILQLWSLPSAERVRGISRSYVKGHRAIIVVVRPGEIESIPQVLQDLSLTSETLFMIVVIGSVLEAEEEISRLSSFFEKHPTVQALPNVTTAIKLVANKLVKRGEENLHLPLIGVLTEEECPIYEPEPPMSSTPPNSESELDEIREVALNLGLRIVGNLCAVEMNEGITWIDMRTGSVQIEPQICRLCSASCKKKSNLCIIGSDSGWSSEKLRSRALLTIAKIHALSSRKLPKHVEKQIHGAVSCTRFQLSSEASFDDIPEVVLNRFNRPESRKSLLEVAEERLREGRLSEAGYSMLKKKLHNLEASQS
ncbi:MAG: hypothetical protein ACW98U_03045 [Candidatus Thorarchaeota archaeon]|jgi:hypothetical protein